MLLTFGEMTRQLAIDLKYGPEAGDDVTIRLRRLLNEAHRRLLRAANYADQREIALPLVTVANQETYGVAQAFDRIQRIVQPSGSRRLGMRTPDWLLNMDPQNTTIGDPEVWIPIGQQAVARQPPVGGSGVWAASTSANDVTPQVRLIAVRAGGGMTRPQIATLTGPARVQVGAHTDLSSLVQFTLSTPAEGDVSLWDAATAGNFLGMIDRYAGTSQPYYSVRLWPTPQGALNYIVTGTVILPDMIFDTDVPRVSPEYADALMVYARRAEYKTAKDDVDRFLAEDAEWERVLGELRAFGQFPPDWRPVAGGPGDRTRWSNLGGYYPPDGWGWSG